MSYEKWRHQVAERTPAPVRNWVAAARLARLRQRNASRSAQEVFSEVYAARQWGLGDRFDSGTGSRGDAPMRYADFIRRLIEDSGARSAVDIGCGDFRVASMFVDALERYEGVDVVPDLISRNLQAHGRPGVNFSLLDAANDDLPEADVCLIRQVLQHLSNAQITAILDRCRRYPLVVVTEHVPAPDRAREPNRDKPHGPDTRLDTGSWVDIELSPFGCAPVREVLRIPAPTPLYSPGEMLRSQLWRPVQGGQW
ncbi:class I SAM-dependent methyltransferase [Rugosimonospora acidiphila]|uniref:Class I SAM-dependent methyltransferase n=1 Tax=Rugosimonospora acidiphila TaxID=556531 RepID=A0ABP9SJQ5_9ACTN